MNVNKAKVEDVHAEAFEGIVIRVLITADDEETLKLAAIQATATPATVIKRPEAGIERYLSKDETLDGRPGAIVQFWGAIDPKKPFSDSLKGFEIEVSFLIRQNILVKPFTAIYDAIGIRGYKGEGFLDMLERVGHCGDGYERTEVRHGRKVIVVPTMVPDFTIQKLISYGRGVMGANIWLMCKDKETVKEAGRKVLEAIHNVPGVITPFGICSAGSKPGTKYPWIGPTTNEVWCPSLKSRLGFRSKVPEGVNYIPEIVIDGITMKAAKQAMKAGIEAAADLDGVVKISAGNYGGRLGKYKIYLQELV